jgi:hypothetical protein
MENFISECNIPSKTESKEGEGKKSEDRKARKYEIRYNINNNY